MNAEDDRLKTLRERIDALDEEILRLLAERTGKVREIGRYKHEHNLAPLDKKRWQAVMESRTALANELNLSPDFISKLYELIHEYALEVEAEADS